VTKPLPLSDFRAIRHVLEEHEYASGGEEVPPTDLVEHSVWDHITFLHGYYRSSLSNLRSALELVTIGAFGNLRPKDPVYLRWSKGDADLSGCSLFSTFLCQAIPTQSQGELGGNLCGNW